MTTTLFSKQFKVFFIKTLTIIAKTVLLLSLIILLSSRLTYAQNSNEIDAIYKEYNNSNTPGIAVSVVKDGNVIYQKGFGIANLEYEAPITEKTKFHVASLSKQFTAFMILNLEADGLLSINDDVRNYIPELPDYNTVITINHLLTHSSGIRDQWRLLEMAGWRLDDVIKTEQIFNLIKNQNELNFVPGDNFRYSNSGYTLLAIIIERLTKMSFEDYAKKIIFDPLQMNDSFFYNDYEELVNNRAYSYKKVDEKFKKSNLNFATVGPTSLFTTVEDMSKWAMNFHKMTVGNKTIFKSMNKKAKKNDGSVSSYAKGQFVKKYKGLKMIYHSGSDAGYRCYFARFPNLGYQFMLFANASYINAPDEIFKLIDHFLKDKYPKNKSTPSQEEAFPYDEDIFINLSSSEMKKFEGTYFDYETQEYIEIKLENDTLYFKGGALSEITELRPVGKSNFKITGTAYDISVNFKDNDDQEPILDFRIPDVMWIYYDKVDKVNPSDHLGTYYNDELKTKYDLVEKNNELYLIHPRLEDIKVTPINELYFSSENRNFSEIRFKRNNSGEVIEFSVSNEGVGNITFLKEI